MAQVKRDKAPGAHHPGYSRPRGPPPDMRQTKKGDSMAFWHKAPEEGKGPKRGGCKTKRPCRSGQRRRHPSPRSCRTLFGERKPEFGAIRRIGAKPTSTGNAPQGLRPRELPLSGKGGVTEDESARSPTRPQLGYRVAPAKGMLLVTGPGCRGLEKLVRRLLVSPVSSVLAPSASCASGSCALRGIGPPKNEAPTRPHNARQMPKCGPIGARYGAFRHPAPVKSLCGVLRM